MDGKGKDRKNYLEKMSMIERKKNQSRMVLGGNIEAFFMWCRVVATVGGVGMWCAHPIFRHVIQNFEKERERDMERVSGEKRKKYKPFIDFIVKGTYSMLYTDTS